MNAKVNYALVGLFVLGLGAAFIIGILWLATGAFQAKYDLYLAIVDESVSGLNLNAPVKYSGVEVGKVSEMELDPNNPARVRLIFAIKRGTPIKEDTVAVLRIQGLTGIAYIELTGGSLNAAPLRAAAAGRMPEIRTKASLSARLENMLSTLLAKLDSTSTSINAIFSKENRVAISSAVTDISTIARTIAARKEALDAGIENAARTFENSARVSAEMGAVIERIGDSADAIRVMGNDASKASVSAGKTVESIGGDVKRFTVDTLPELERFIGELIVLTASLRRLSERAERDPRSLLFGQKPVMPGPGEESRTKP
jgi:phospholipid/cholesterol/gamma-HCH transport system substrate-binding protein